MLILYKIIWKCGRVGIKRAMKVGYSSVKDDLQERCVQNLLRELTDFYLSNFVLRYYIKVNILSMVYNYCRNTYS